MWVVGGRRGLVRWLGWRRDLGEDLISARPPPWSTVNERIYATEQPASVWSESGRQ